MRKHSQLYAGLECLAMGDTQAVEIAQTCHLGLCLQEHVFESEKLIAMSLPLPRSKVAAGIVIDDFVSIAAEARGPASVKVEPTEVARIADRALSAYRKEKLIPHAEKLVRDALNLGRRTGRR